MIKFTSLVTLLAAVVVCLLPAAPALAQRDRVFVASYGSDSNPCTFGSPCKTFQNAVNVVAQGGEVTAIDSAGFGTFTISHAVTITSPNGVEAGVAAPASGSAAITINAQSGDVISLNGLTLDGDNVASTIGIQFNSGGALHVQNCVIRNFGANGSNAGDGIDFVPNASTSSQISVSNTVVSDNAVYGIYINPTGSGPTIGALDHVELDNNAYNGLFVFSNSSTTNVSVTDSVIANSGITNNGAGIYAESLASTPVKVMVRDSTIANNTGDGLFAENTGATIRVSRSTITGNGAGWAITSTGTVTSFGDNEIIDNTTTVAAPPKSTEE